MSTYGFDIVRRMEVDEYGIINILDAAIEHCLKTWCCGIEVSDDAEDPDVTTDIIKGKPLWFYSSNTTAHRLTLKSFLDGFQQWVCDGRDLCGILCGDHLIPEFMEEDIWLCDEILQYALFGRLKFDVEGRPV